MSDVRKLIIPFFIVGIVVLPVVFTPSLGSANPDVMSFNEAIDAVSLGNYNIIKGGYSIMTIGDLEQAPFVDERGITGFLAWLAPNRTIYQVEYPSEKVLGKRAKLTYSDYNPPPDGHVFWWLNYKEGIPTEYWVDVSDGSIIFVWVPRLGGPVSEPTDPFAITNTILYAIIAVVAIVAVATVATFKFKRKTNKESTKTNLYSPREISFCS